MQPYPVKDTIMLTSDIHSRAQGCLLGQLVGDALGSQVEFLSQEKIRTLHPHGVREMSDGGSWDTIAGQITDDSEMAIMLARTIVRQGTYNSESALASYQYWLGTHPFDCGNTIRAALQGRCTIDSQANGALMRISPLAIFGIHYTPGQLAKWAMEDAEITHPHPICQQANALFCLAISEAIRTRSNPELLYQRILNWARMLEVEKELLETVDKAALNAPTDYVHQAGWVLVAFQNALWQMLHARDFEEALVDTINRGGDTDTNAAICGALLGALYGRSAIPQRWSIPVLNCRPESGNLNISHPRPRALWAIDALDLVNQLIGYDRRIYEESPYQELLA